MVRYPPSTHRKAGCRLIFGRRRLPKSTHRKRGGAHIYRADFSLSMASPSYLRTAVATAASFLVSVASFVIINVAVGMQPTVSGNWVVAAAGIGGAGASCSARESLTCDHDRTTRRRCECAPTCHYFGSCCQSELDAETAALTASAAFNASGGGGGRGVDSCSAKRLQRGLYKCELQRYGDWPTYVIDRCPEASGQPRQLARLCDQDLRENNYFDARFWPVSSNVNYLVYQSVYCALCHGESTRNVTRWTASLNCPNDTDLADRTQLLRRCKVLFAPPAAFDPPRCWNHFVDKCELRINQTVKAAIVAAGCGAAADEPSYVPVGRAARMFDATAAESLEFADTNSAVACYREPQAVVWWGTTPFRNSYCAECSGLNRSQLACSEVKYDPLVQYPGISFRALLDPFGGRHVVGGGPQMHCSGDEYYDHLLGACTSLCPSGTVLAADGSRCEATKTPFQPSVATLTTIGDRYTSMWTLMTVSNQTQHLSNANISGCKWSSYDAAVAALNTSNPLRSTVLTVAGGSGNNGSSSYNVLFVVPSVAARATAVATQPESATALCAYCSWITLSTAIPGSVDRSLEASGRRWSLRPPVVRFTEAATIACVDPARAGDYTAGVDDRNSGSCGAVLDAIGLALMIASIACLAVHAVAFFFISSLRNMPGRVVFSQVIALLLAFSLFLSRIAAATDASACYALGVALHYFLLAYFVWTLVLAVEIHGAVRVLKKVYSGERQFAAYSLFGWLLPLVIVIAAVLTDLHGPSSMRPGYGPPQCWMSGGGASHGFVMFFAAPMGLVVLAGIVLYAAIVVRIAVISRHTARARRATKQQREKAVLCGKLLLALGILWVFAVAGAFSGNLIIICVFSNVLNASQGVFLFAVFFCSNSRIAELLHCRELGERIRSYRLASGSLLSSVVATGNSTAQRSRYKKTEVIGSSICSSSGAAKASTTRPTDWLPPPASSEEHGRDETEIDQPKELMAVEQQSQLPL